MTLPAWGRTLAAATAGGAAALGTRRFLAGRPPGGRAQWTRTNFRDREVDLLAGPAAAAGAVAAAIAAGRSGLSSSQTAGLVVAVGSSAALGLYDDLAGVTHARGLRGHLTALRRGEVTTGIVKLAGLFVAGLVAVLPGSRRRPGRATRQVDRLLDAALVSGTANLVNLLDLRPGRALKVLALLATPLALADNPAAIAAAGAAGTAGALLPGDLDERHMVGDCGANALGALLGWTIARRSGPLGRKAALGAVVALTLASERVSFSAVIDRQPVLAALDRWGRRPA